MSEQSERLARLTEINRQIAELEAERRRLSIEGVWAIWEKAKIDILEAKKAFDAKRGAE